MKKIISVFLSLLYAVSSLLVFPVTAQAKLKSITLDSTVTFTFDKKHKEYSFLFDVPESGEYTVYTENGLIDATIIAGQYYEEKYEEYDMNMQYGWGIAHTPYIAETNWYPRTSKSSPAQIIVVADVEAAGVESATITFGIKTHKCEMIPYKIRAGQTYNYIEANGRRGKVCKYCGRLRLEENYIPSVDLIELSKDSYVYDGKVKKPSVTVFCNVYEDECSVVDNKNYTVTYPKDCKNVGKYKIKIKFKNDYEGSAEKYFTIKPKSTSISKLTAGKKKFTVKWKKQATQTSGYEIQYAANSKFTKDKKTVTVKSNKTTSKSISKLKAKKKYYVRVRTYKTVNGKKIYSDWSKAKTVTTKK